MIKFQGILGNVCGKQVPFEGVEADPESVRLRARGFIIQDGIETLRGFAKISDLAKASKKDPNYQRSHEKPTGLKHIEGLKEFLNNGKTQAKFLPEVILVGRAGGYSKTKLLAEKGVNPVAQGEIDSLDLYSIEVEDQSLFRVDGNHRLEAGAELDYYVPFAIILWGQSTTASDDEAFLFYFLNGKAKKLTPEENYSALVKSPTWTMDEIKKVHPTFGYLKLFYEQFLLNNSLFKKEFFIEPLSQVSNVIDHISEQEPYAKSEDEFKALISDLNIILPQHDRFSHLKQHFNYLLPELIFYALYKMPTRDEALQLVLQIDSWAKQFNYTEGSFDNPIKLFNIAKKYLEFEEIPIFVAMPYYDDERVKQYNISFETVVKRIKEKNPELKLYLFPIMTHKGASFEINSDILDKIRKCKIFIADISNDNPNVMYELGLAQSINKKIILFRSSEATGNPPFDIITRYREPFNPQAPYTIEASAETHIKSILKNDLGIPLKE